MMLLMYQHAITCHHGRYLALHVSGFDTPLGFLKGWAHQFRD